MLHQELLDHIDRPVEFYVYNTDTDEVRVVVLMPTAVSRIHSIIFADGVSSICFWMFIFIFNIQDWGEDGDRGVLGANVAFG